GFALGWGRAGGQPAALRSALVFAKRQAVLLPFADHARVANAGGFGSDCRKPAGPLDIKHEVPLALRADRAFLLIAKLKLLWFPERILRPSPAYHKPEIEKGWPIIKAAGIKSE